MITGLQAEAIAYARETGRDVDERERSGLPMPPPTGCGTATRKDSLKCSNTGLTLVDARSALDNMCHADQVTFNQYVDDEPLKRPLATRLALARPTRRQSTLHDYLVPPCHEDLLVSTIGAANTADT